MRLIAIITIILNLAVGIQDDSEDFSGTITYKYTKLSSDGKVLAFPQELESMHISSSKILVQTVSGQIKYVLGYDLLIDLLSKRRFEIHHDDKTILEVPNEKGAEVSLDSYEETASESKVLNLPCKVVRFRRIDVHSGDTIRYRYFFNEKFQKKNLKDFAILQANANTLFLDGRFQSIPLKVEMQYPNGELVTIDAVNATYSIDESIFSYPSYRLIKTR